jgi:hypothetical protein
MLISKSKITNQQSKILMNVILSRPHPGKPGCGRAEGPEDAPITMLMDSSLTLLLWTRSDAPMPPISRCTDG